MDDNSKFKFAAAVVAGYVLGRTKTGKLALGVLALAAGRSLDPAALIGQGVRKLADTPQFEQLEDQIRSELLNAGRSALTAATNRSLGSLTDSLQQRTNALRNGGASEEEQDAEEEDLDEEASVGDSAEDEGEADEEETSRQPRRPQAKKRASKKTAEKKPPAKKAASRDGRRR